MRDPKENVTALQKQLNELQLENQLLRNILDRAGVPYAQELLRLRRPEEIEEYDPNQGARIIHPDAITEKMANVFFSWFWGRQDVYVKRAIKKNGETGYFTQCWNFWKEVCPRRYGQKTKCSDCKYRDHKALTKRDIIAHLQGAAPDGTDVIGVYPLLPNGTCRFLVFDFDNHEKDAEKNDFANTDDEWVDEVEAMRMICAVNGIDPLVERSRSGRGAHLWLFFDKPVPAGLARRFGYALLEKGAEQVNLKSFKYYDRMLPAQDSLPEGGLGNLIALPLQGRALLDGNSAFIDKSWNAYPNQWEALRHKPRLSREFLQIKIREWSSWMADSILEENDGTRGGSGENSGSRERERPWENNRKFDAADVDGHMSITLSNGIYIDTMNLLPRIQNRIRRLAAFSNPVFYRNEKIKTSNYATSRWVYLGEDHPSGYIQIPRGLREELISRLDKAGISYDVDDERQQGREIKVSFSGTLRDEQKPALAEMIKYDNGILHAATAFGKTVVCSAIIAEKKVNTLIILQSSSLLGQWEEALLKFLDIDEEPPEYTTKSGRIRKRKSPVGKLQAQHDSMTGIIDIAMAGSLCKKGEFHDLLPEYGMIIVDECHHAASDTIAEVLREVKARYVYGVTATPNRGDGLEKINYMLLGPIRYRYTSKEKAKAQGIDHLVYPRFTRAVPPLSMSTDAMHPNEAYEIIRDNDTRDEQIAEDVKDCVASGRTPVILSKYRDHSEKLYDRVASYADHVFLMTGNNSKREHKQILEEMQKVPSSESLILVATGKLIGEGFDFPRLDTLIMATPVSFKGVVEQYAGRLNRDYDGKENVIVYDYVDSHIPMFDNMYAKRLKAYKQIGYEICSGVKGEKQSANAIFNTDNYELVYRQDLLGAGESIVISSPAISGAKVRELIDLLAEVQKRGVLVTVVTWQPDAYDFGDPAYWMQLHEEMRQAGFHMRLVDQFCEHFAIIDREVVWYGSINLLAKARAEDSMMRVVSGEIAAELLEMTTVKDERKENSEDTGKNK